MQVGVNHTVCLVSLSSLKILIGLALVCSIYYTACPVIIIILSIAKKKIGCDSVMYTLNRSNDLLIRPCAVTDTVSARRPTAPMASCNFFTALRLLETVNYMDLTRRC